LSLLLLAAFIALTLAAAPSLAVVTYDPNHPTNPGTDTSPFTTPGSDYYGMNWSYVYRTGSGTSVAIDYFTLLTAAHYTTAIGSEFTVNGGDTFRVTSTETLAPDLDQTTPPDLRVVHVVNETNQYRPLPGFYDLYTYTGSDWPTDTTSFVIVGTGDTGSTANTTYYTDTSGTSGVRRWGTNRFDRLTRRKDTDTSGVTLHSTWCIKMSYDRENASHTPYESGIGNHDSGSGVFVKDGDTWKLAGINLYRATYRAGYRDFYAASIPYYAPKLYAILDDMLPGDADLDGDVDSYDYITLKANFGRTDATWSQGDFNGDHLVGYEDFIALTTNFGYNPHLMMTPPSGGYISTGGTAMPEPGSAILLALGAAALLRRRRQG
jgi:hypothetical protein